MFVEKQITRKAFQWDGSYSNLPEGFFQVRPEVHWSADHSLIYFTYGTLRVHSWMGVPKLVEEPAKGGLEGYHVITDSKAGTKYYRKVLPFAFWEVKSEASMRARRGDTLAHAAIFITEDDDELVDLLTDYALISNWKAKLTGPDWTLPQVEYREISGGYGRGYCPHYMNPGDWLVEGSKPGSTSVTKWHVATDKEMAA